MLFWMMVVGAPLTIGLVYHFHEPKPWIQEIEITRHKSGLCFARSTRPAWKRHRYDNGDYFTQVTCPEDGRTKGHQ